jgi:hypothetical protein
MVSIRPKEPMEIEMTKPSKSEKIVAHCHKGPRDLIARAAREVAKFRDTTGHWPSKPLVIAAVRQMRRYQVDCGYLPR